MRRPKTGKALRVGMALAALAGEASAQGAKELESHAMGNAYLSWGLFAILAIIAFYLVFKGTRTK